MGNPFQRDEKTFSIITPVYKDAYKTLSKFFQSLSEQDYHAFEVIIVFDGKNPKGAVELAAVSAKYPDIAVTTITQEHGGAPKARNTGAAKATGDYLSFLDPDVYLYTETLRIWANAFEEHPDKDVIWGLYDVELEDRIQPIGGSVPVNVKGEPDYYAFRYSNYCSGAFPVRKEAFVGWDETVISLQDWDMWVRMLKQDDFQGKKFYYINRPFFVTDPPHKGGISDDSHQNWLERVKYVKKKNDIPLSPLVVTSLGAPFHGVHVAKKLGADYLPMPSYKPHEYKAIYLLGFYPDAAIAHGQVFERDGKDAKKIIHFIGTDIYKLQWKIPFKALQGLKAEWEKPEYVLLTEAKHTHDEMMEMGFETQIVPIPPQKLYDPMPLPEKFTVAVYENNTQAMYHEDLMQEVARSLPDIQFYFFGNETTKGDKTKNTEHLGWIDLDEWVPKFSCNLRVTVHDGLPITPLQFLTAGRQVVTNVPLKGAIQAEPTRKSIIEGIRKAQTNPEAATDAYWKKELDFEKYVTTIRGFYE